MRIAFVTFGCRLNRAESLDLEALMSAAGHEIIPLPPGSDPIDASGATTPCPLGSVPTCLPDLIIVRGCSVTAKAQRDCEKAIEHLRRRFPNAQIAITGCLPNASPLPYLSKGSDLTIPRGQTPISPPIKGPDPVPQWGQTLVPTSTSRAYLKIQDGCNGKCSFCIVPHFRGPSVSIPLADIIAHARSFIADGYGEIVVTGCNLSLYNSNGTNLPSLLNILADLSPLGSDPTDLSTPGSDPTDMSPLGSDPTEASGVAPTETSGSDPTETASRHRIRLGSLEPGILNSQILDVFEKHQNICRFLHLSIQSGSDRILSAMNRPYRIKSVADFIKSMRKRFGPNIMLGADVITGFPGETIEDFNATRSFLEDNDFTNVHAFPFSERPGTPAATMAGSVPMDARRERARAIIEDAAGRRRRFARSFIGREVEVCVESGGDHGWTNEYLQMRLGSIRPRRSLVRTAVAAIKDDILLELPIDSRQRI